MLKLNDGIQLDDEMLMSVCVVEAGAHAQLVTPTQLWCLLFHYRKTPLFLPLLLIIPA